MTEYVPRLVDTVLDRFLAEFPAVMLVGLRACGKTTTAARRANSIARLDTADAAAFELDADAALRGRPAPVLLDEWQLVPGVLGAVKRAVDSDRTPGRFLLTGSARSDSSDRFWPATGRVVMVTMCPLTVSELQRLPTDPFVDRVARGELGLRHTDSAQVDLVDYLRMALKGGLPEPALHLGADASRAWLESYADQVVLRDTRTHGALPDASRLQRYLQACATTSATCTQHQTLYDMAGINRKTAVAYDKLLGDLMVTDQLPAWSTNRAKRLTRAPKRYITDSGLMAGILRVGIDDVLSDASLQGALMETFVVSQLRAEAVASDVRYRLSHLRSQDGRHEVDVIAEFGGGRVVGIEVKSSSRVTPRDARHLSWLRDKLEDRFAAGVVLHTGQDTYELANKVLATPISTLWT